MGVIFIDNSKEVKLTIKRATVAGLEEAASEIQSQAERNTPVDTGQLRGAWDHVVDEGRLEATIGNTLEYSIFQEFGTGEYALEGNGRRGGWFYKDAEGKGHFTHGNKPVRMLHNAFTQRRNVAVNLIEDAYKRELG